MVIKSKTLVFTAILIFCNLFVFSFIVLAEENSNQIISVQEDSQNILGLALVAKKFEEANNLLKNNQAQEAENVLIEAKLWLTEATQQHYELSQALSKDATTTNSSKIEKAHALDFGKLRDEISLLLAKAYIKQNKLKEAVRQLVEITKSQPTTIIGKEAYKLLQEIKFSDNL